MISQLRNGKLITDQFGLRKYTLKDKAIVVLNDKSIV